MSRTTQDTANPQNLSNTGLSPSMVTLSKVFFFVFASISQSYNPNDAETSLVWAVPVSLATTKGITIVFFSSGYLDVSVLRVCFPINRDDAASRHRVAPFGNLRI